MARGANDLHELLGNMDRVLKRTLQSVQSACHEVAVLQEESTNLRQALGEASSVQLKPAEEFELWNRSSLGRGDQWPCEEGNAAKSDSIFSFAVQDKASDASHSSELVQWIAQRTSRRKTTIGTAIQKMHNLRRKRSEHAVAIWQFFDEPDSSCSAQCYSKLLDVIIQTSVILSVMQTLQDPLLDMGTFGLIQTCIDLFFFAELVVRFYCCPMRSSFVCSPYNINDFVAAALPLSLRACQSILNEELDAGAVKYIVFCVAPVLRELKMLRRMDNFYLFLILLDDTKEALRGLMMLLAIVILVSSSLLFLFEPTSSINSMPQAVYFAIVTVTTVGYGDIAPKSPVGTCVASLLTLFSILYTSMPISIIGNAFTKIWQDRDRILLMRKTRDMLLQSGLVALDLQKIFDEYDEYDGVADGKVSFEGFLHLVQDLQLGFSEERAIDVFESLDRDGGGTISLSEFVRFIFPRQFHSTYKDGVADGVKIGGEEKHAGQAFTRPSLQKQKRKSLRGRCLSDPGGPVSVQEGRRISTKSVESVNSSASSTRSERQSVTMDAQESGSHCIDIASSSSCPADDSDLRFEASSPRRSALGMVRVLV